MPILSKLRSITNPNDGDTSLLTSWLILVGLLAGVSTVIILVCCGIAKVFGSGSSD